MKQKIQDIEMRQNEAIRDVNIYFYFPIYNIILEKNQINFKVQNLYVNQLAEIIIYIYRERTLWN